MYLAYTTVQYGATLTTLLPVTSTSNDIYKVVSMMALSTMWIRWGAPSLSYTPQSIDTGPHIHKSYWLSSMVSTFIWYGPSLITTSGHWHHRRSAVQDKVLLILFPALIYGMSAPFLCQHKTLIVWVYPSTLLGILVACRATCLGRF